MRPATVQADSEGEDLRGGPRSQARASSAGTQSHGPTEMPGPEKYSLACDQGKNVVASSLFSRILVGETQQEDMPGVGDVDSGPDRTNRQVRVRRVRASDGLMSVTDKAGNPATRPTSAYYILLL